MWQALVRLTNPVLALTLTFVVLGRTSGWFLLASKFPQITEYGDDWDNFQTISLQGISFNRCMEIGISSKAIFLRPCFPLNLIFTPLEIPWTEIQSARRSENYWKKTIQLRIDNPNVLITLKEEQIRRAQPYLPLDAT